MVEIACSRARTEVNDGFVYVLELELGCVGGKAV